THDVLTEVVKAAREERLRREAAEREARERAEEEARLLRARAEEQELEELRKAQEDARTQEKQRALARERRLRTMAAAIAFGAGVLLAIVMLVMKYRQEAAKRKERELAE